jgi:hypothetical protein
MTKSINAMLKLALTFKVKIQILVCADVTQIEISYSFLQSYQAIVSTLLSHKLQLFLSPFFPIRR